MHKKARLISILALIALFFTLSCTDSSISSDSSECDGGCVLYAKATVNNIEKSQKICVKDSDFYLYLKESDVDPVSGVCLNGQISTCDSGSFDWCKAIPFEVSDNNDAKSVENVPVCCGFFEDEYRIFLGDDAILYSQKLCLMGEKKYCSTEPPVISTNTQDCSQISALQDTDNDGITDSWPDCRDKDKCDDSISGCEVYSEEYPEPGVIGCSKYACESECKVAGGSGIDEDLNLHIVFTPCGFSNEIDFETKALSAANILLGTFPFTESSSQEKFKISYIWSKNKQSPDQFQGDDNIYDLCYRPNEDQTEIKQIAKNIASKCNENEPNTVYIELINGDPGYGSYNGIIAEQYLEMNYQSFEDRFVHLFSTNEYFNENLLHELGHAFKFANQQDFIFIKEDMLNDHYNPKNNPQPEIWNDVYVPDLPGVVNVETLPVCPIWNGILAITNSPDCGENGIHMGCWAFYEGYGNKYSLCDGDIMSLQRNREAFFNPVQEFMIQEILQNGYSNYLKFKYLHRCSEIGGENIRSIGYTDRDFCINTECSYINPHQENNIDYINRVTNNEGAISNIYACCSQIFDSEIKKNCQSFDSLHPPP